MSSAGPVVLLAGGGSAGHVEPALALADAVREQWPGSRPLLLGTPAGLENRLVPARGYPLLTVPKVALPRSVTPALVGVPHRLLAAARSTRRLLADHHVDLVVGFGGYASLPAYLAARWADLPVVVHEANPRPGLANRVGALLTPYVAVASAGTPLSGHRGGRAQPAVVTGIPLRRSILTLDRQAGRASARARLGLDPDRACLLVFGGSQGAQHINQAVAQASPSLTGNGLQLLHLTGAAHREATAALLGPHPSPYHHLRDYLDDMSVGYAAADLALCRSGALTCAELSAVALPAIYVPLPIGNGEQRDNAAPAVAAGGAVVVEDRDLDAATVSSSVLAVLTDPTRLAAMRLGARAASPGDGAALLLALLHDVLGTPRRR